MKFNKIKLFIILTIINLVHNQIEASNAIHVTCIDSETFEKKAPDFWVIKDHDAYVNMSKSLFDSDGNWIPQFNPPQYIQYLGSFDLDDTKLLVHWLKLKELSCFSLTEKNKCNAFDIIYKWYHELLKQNADISALNIYKVAWLDDQSLIHELYAGKSSDIPSEWLEANRLFYLRYNEFKFDIHHKVSKVLDLFKHYAAPSKKGKKNEELKKLFHKIKVQLLDLYDGNPKQFFLYLADLNYGYASTLSDQNEKNNYLEQVKYYRELLVKLCGAE